MPSGPRLFDDGDDSTDSGPSNAPAHSAGAPQRQVDEPGTDAPLRRNPSGRPNYLVRRAIVIGGVVAVLATASVVIGQLMGSGGTDTSSGAVPADWDRVVVLDERTGRVTIRDDAGTEIGRVESGVASPTGSRVVESSMVVLSDDSVAVVDLERADDDPSAAATTTAPSGTAPTTPSTSTAESADTEATDGATDGETDGATTTFGFGADGIVTPTGSALTMIAPRPDAARGVLVHGPSGDVIDTDSFAPVIGARYEFASSRSAPSGRAVLVTDSGNFQSVLFSFDRDEPSFFPGLALAVDDDVVVTAQNVGADATVNVFDHAGGQLSTGSTPSVRAGMIAGDSVVLITVDGAVLTMSLGSGDTGGGGQLDIGSVASGHVTTSGDRLIVSGADGVAVVDSGANTIGTYPGARLADGDAPPTGSQCVALVPVVPDPEPQLTLVDLTDGTSIVDSVDTAVTEEGEERTPLLTDASGCTIAIPTSWGYQLLTADVVEQVTTNDVLVALTPDAAQAVVERTGRLMLVDPAPDGQTATPIDVGREGAAVHFTQS